MNHFSPAAFLYILLIALLIVMRNVRPRRIRVKSLWISPTVISALSIYVLVVVPDQTPIWLRTASGVIGVALGGAFRVRSSNGSRRLNIISATGA
jgi:hypothetical protein